MILRGRKTFVETLHCNVSTLIKLGAIALLFIFLISCTPKQSSSLTVSAAASLRNVLEEVKQEYAKSQPDVKINYNFGASGALQQQIEQGADVDIFVSAAAKQMDALESKKLLITDTRKNILGNQIVLIVPKNAEEISSFADLKGDRITKIALGEPKSVPAGKYAQEVLSYFKILETTKSKFVFAKDVRQVLSYVETENVDAGFVYITDAKQSSLVKIVAIAPVKSHSPVIYPVAVIQSSKNVAQARIFTGFLLSREANNIYRKYGFNKPSIQ
ncbi:molybdate ABC transporter substrate-binding protein [Chlorogloea sp. CCALA 695]|uniref:molybdate ABC transporter substrate-binding protein n=1 Tax=Chlorogloea sp. CCALA 695 TaxID=2107693 RepID=UPI000D04D33A|nr:molybdate ABC transporter substrate-binding protein [Chlorogloea sp. CCALA 695]PSB35144.1 molybdate ABC transporter substrate-binding protein [Chlorogloea sp. CCALA 695]